MPVLTAAQSHGSIMLTTNSLTFDLGVVGYLVYRFKMNCQTLVFLQLMIDLIVGTDRLSLNAHMRWGWAIHLITI